jgi:GTPase
VTPLVAIVGRPNVGKSTLFNRFVGSELAIVHNQPGVTRDRHYADAHLHGRDVTLIDTGGFDPTDADALGRGIARHVEAAIAEADVILCVLDGTASPTPADREAVALLRRSKKPVLYAANKTDDGKKALVANDLYTLGIDRLFPVSAAHGRGLHELEAALVALLPPPAEPTPRPDRGVPHIAILGRPNAGKSTLFNRLCGEERSLVDDRPGTTVDPVDTLVEMSGRQCVLVDTAGIRRKSRVSTAVESASVMRAIRAVGRADVIVLLCDATGTVSEQDARLLGLVAGRGRAIVIGLSKIDLVVGKKQKAKAVEEARDSLHFAPWSTIVPVSSRTGEGLKELERTILSAWDAYQKRIGTGALNRFFAEVLDRQPPPTHGGKAPRLYYVTQAEAAPPVFVVMCNTPEAVKDSYRRFVTNQIRKTFEFHSVPVIVHFRGKPKREASDRFHGAPKKEKRG